MTDPGVVNMDPIARRLADLRMPVRTDLGATAIKVRLLEDSPEGVAVFLRDNEANPADIRDCVYGIIITTLKSLEFINETCKDVMPTGTELDNIPKGILDADLLDRYRSQVKPICVLAIASYCQGNWEESIPWYQSFCNVQGSFISEPRLKNIMKMIIACDNFCHVFGSLTISDVKQLNNVYLYRFKRIAAPSLVRIALSQVPFGEIRKHFSASELDDYRAADQAGLVLQIAAGPLRSFCTGTVSPYSIDENNYHLPLCALAAVDNFPFHTDTVKKAAIILEESKYATKKWYQGDKALSTLNANDLKFKAKVRAAFRKLREEAEAMTDIGEMDFDDEVSTAEEIKAIMAAWGTRG